MSETTGHYVTHQKGSFDVDGKPVDYELSPHPQGGMKMTLQDAQGVMAAHAALLGDVFREIGGPNYVEMKFRDEQLGDMVLTLQLVSGKTPHELRTEAETAREALLDTIQGQVAYACAESDGTLNSRAQILYADALRTLAAAGRVEIVQERGRCVAARWKDGGA